MVPRPAEERIADEITRLSIRRISARTTLKFALTHIMVAISIVKAPLVASRVSIAQKQSRSSVYVIPTTNVRPDSRVVERQAPRFVATCYEMRCMMMCALSQAPTRRPLTAPARPIRSAE